jgi:hypothetical protein
LEAKWLCRCSCGNTKEVIGSSLKNGHSKSCGCLQKDINIKRATKHGCANTGKLTKEYKAYWHMYSRCTNPNNAGYKNYGGRGITICDRWLEPIKGFTNFLEDVGYAPSSEYSLDRINNDGNYETGNIRWATRTVQNINQRIQSNNKSGVKGVGWHKKANKWQARIGINNKIINLGLFSNLEDAIKARLETEERYHALACELQEL